MALRIVADSPDDLPEGLREHAKAQETGGVVVSDMPDGWAIENIAGLKASVATARAEREEARKLAKAFEGIDPAKAGEAREALEKLAAGQLRGSKEIEEYKASLESKFAKDRESLEQKLTARTEALRDHLSRGVMAPIIAAKGGSESMDAILTLASRHLTFTEDETGAIKPSLVSGDGKPLVTKKAGSADPMGFEEFIEQMRESPATRGLFRASAAGGSGSSSQTGGSGRAASLDITKMSPVEIMALEGNR